MKQMDKALIVFIGAVLLSCSGCGESMGEEEMRTVVLRVLAPNRDAQFIEGQAVEISLDIKENNEAAQLLILNNGVEVFTKKGVSQKESLVIPADQIKLGFNELEIQLTGF